MTENKIEAEDNTEKTTPASASTTNKSKLPPIVKKDRPWENIKGGKSKGKSSSSKGSKSLSYNTGIRRGGI